MAPNRQATGDGGNAALAYAHLHEQAVNYRVRPGRRIKESEVAKYLSISRSPVREALNRLASEGLVSFEHNRGFLARELDPREVRELFELRAGLEAQAFRLACERADDNAIKALRDHWERLLDHRAALSLDQLIDGDEDFHRRLAGLAGNRELSATLETINARIRFVRRIEIARPERNTTTFVEHAALLEHLQQRAAERGAALIASHITLSAQDALDAIKEGLATIFLERDVGAGG